MAVQKKTTFKPNVLLATVLAWLVPGAGHLYLRRWTRGTVILVVLAATFWSGMAMGGAMTIYSEAEPWWFIADLFTGVHGMAAWQHHRTVYDRVCRNAIQRAGRDWPGNDPAMQSVLIEDELKRQDLDLVAPVDPVARAYSGVAGLMNLLCIFDAMMLALMGRSGEPVGDPKPSPAGAASSPRPSKGMEERT